MLLKKYYLHFVLTVIAVCLIVITVQNQFLLLRSQQEASEVKKITHSSFQALYQTVHSGGAQKFAWVPVNEDGSIDVRIKKVMDVMDVDIVGIDGYDLPRSQGALPVIIKEKK